MTGLPEPAFLLQCCDAGHYLALGQYCAAQGACVDGLRPVGALLWFSLPHRLGLDPAYLIYANIALLLVSVLLSVLAVLAVARLRWPGLRWLPFSGLALAVAFASFLSHAVFFWPVLQVALVDAPAGLLFLTGIWLLVLSRHGGAAVCVFLAAWCLGYASWLRAFYLYPVIGGVLVWLLLWLRRRCRPWSQGLLLLALVPAAIQCYVVHERWGEWGFLPMQSTANVRAFHLGSPVAGYDTIYPLEGHFWYTDCPKQWGVAQAVEARDLREGWCLIESRLRFYAGSYAGHTYTAGEFLDWYVFGEIFIDDVGNPNFWGLDNLVREADVLVAPDGKQSVDKVTVVQPDERGAGMLYYYGTQSHIAPHRMAVWLWANRPKSIDLAMYRVNDGAIIARKRVMLGTVPQEYELLGTPLDTGSHGVMIGKLPDATVSFGTEAGDTLYSWKGVLAELPETARFHKKTAPELIRQWLPGLLWLNALMFILAGAWLWMVRQALGAVSGCLAVMLLGVIGQSLLIIPEQRFVIVVFVLCWLWGSLMCGELVWRAAKRMMQGVREIV